MVEYIDFIFSSAMPTPVSFTLTIILSYSSLVTRVRTPPYSHGLQGIGHQILENLFSTGPYRHLPNPSPGPALYQADTIDLGLYSSSGRISVKTSLMLTRLKIGLTGCENASISITILLARSTEDSISARFLFISTFPSPEGVFKQVRGHFYAGQRFLSSWLTAAAIWPSAAIFSDCNNFFCAFFKIGGR